MKAVIAVFFLVVSGISNSFLCAKTPLTVQDSLAILLEKHPAQDTVRAILINELAYATYTNDLEYTFRLAEELNELSKKINYPKGNLNSYNLFGIYYDAKGEYLKAKENYQKALVIAQLNEIEQGISATLNNLGIISEILGEYPEAFEYYHQSLKIDEKGGDSVGIAKTYLQMGGLYEYMSDTVQALKYYRNSLKLANALNERTLMAYNRINIGYIFHEKGKNKEARTLFNEALAISEKDNQQEGVLLSLLMIGILDKEAGDFQVALNRLNNSLAISRSIGAIAYERYCYFHIADNYFRMKKIDKAYDFAKKAFSDEEYMDESLQMTTAELLAEIAVEMKNYKAAYEYHVMFKELNDHSFNEGNVRQIAKLEYEYKIEKEREMVRLKQEKKDAIQEAKRKKELLVRNFILVALLLLIVMLALVVKNIRHKYKANALLSAEKNKLVQANNLLEHQKEKLELLAKELETANHTKDKFFSIIAHDLKSPFTSILGFSEVLLEGYDEFDDDEKMDFLSKIKTGSEMVFILIENLLNWAGSNVGSIKFNPVSLTLKDQVDSLLSIYKSSSETKQIVLKNKVEDNLKVFADKDMIRTILRNLVSNALKFTHEGGEVVVDCKLEKEMAVLQVIDNGVGMESHKAKQLFELNKKSSSLGTKGETGTGLGLVLCKDFVELHNGRIEVKTTLGKGTQINIYLPQS